MGLYRGSNFKILSGVWELRHLFRAPFILLIGKISCITSVYYSIIISTRVMQEFSYPRQRLILEPPSYGNWQVFSDCASAGLIGICRGWPGIYRENLVTMKNEVKTTLITG